MTIDVYDLSETRLSFNNLLPTVSIRKVLLCFNIKNNSIYVIEMYV